MEILSNLPCRGNTFRPYSELVASARPAAPAGDLLAPSVYGHLLRFLLNLSESDAQAIEREHEISFDLAYRLGYRSIPQPSWGVMDDEAEEKRRTAHARFDQMTDDEFFDWLTCSKERLPEPHDYLRDRSRPLYLIQDEIERELSVRFGLFDGVAGFFSDDESMRLSRQFYSRGFLVPVRRNGLIRGLLHYRDANDAEPRWITSRDLPGGAKASPSIHIVNASYVATRGVCVLTRDALRADAAGAGGMICTVGANNLSPFALIHQLRAMLPKLKAVLLDIEPLDMFLLKSLKQAGLIVKVAE